jgi:hypothetical protein
MVLAHKMIMSNLRGGALSTHFVANSRMLCRDVRSTCSAVMSSLPVSVRRSSI